MEFLKKNFVPIIVYSVISLFIIESVIDFVNAIIFTDDMLASIALLIFILMLIQAYTYLKLL